jgi:hypothetical protein
VDLSRAVWRTSTYSGGNGCVEVAFVDGQVGVRDSKARQGPMLVFTASEWEAFIGGARGGEFEFMRLQQPAGLIVSREVMVEEDTSR